MVNLNTVRSSDVGVVVLVGAALLAGITYWMNRRKQKRCLTVPRKWTPVAKVKQLKIYPVKSCKGRVLSTLEVQEFAVKSGSDVDRQFMMVNKVGRLVSGRSHPRTVLISTEKLSANRLALTAPDMPSIELELPSLAELRSQSSARNEVTCNLHGRQVKGLNMGEEVSRWLTEFLVSRSPAHISGDDETVRLVYHHLVPGQRKPTPKEMDLLPLVLDDDQSLFQDMVVAAHLVSTASVDDLNERLKESETEVTVDNFRPNIVVTDCDGYAEDEWEFVKIGGAVFRNTRACSRCVFTTVDPLIAEKHEKLEPLATLRKYRKEQNPALHQLYNYAPKFGIMLCTSRTGTIAVGDVVYAGRSAA